MEDKDFVFSNGEYKVSSITPRNYQLGCLCFYCLNITKTGGVSKVYRKYDFYPTGGEPCYDLERELFVCSEECLNLWILRYLL